MSQFRVWFENGYFGTVLAASADEAIQEALRAREKAGYFKVPKNTKVIRMGCRNERQGA